MSAFADKDLEPDDQMIAEMLGRARGLWADLRQAMEETHGPLVGEWNYSGKSYGWSLRLKRKARALVYMTPCRNYFRASLALGEKACRAAHESAVAPALLAIIDAAPKFPEGRGVRIEVRRKEDVRHVLQLVAFKAAH